MRLVDSHAHLQAEAFSADAAQVLGDARSARVERVMVPGWDLSSSRASIAMAARLGTHASAGVHPHAADQADDRIWAEVVELARGPTVAAIGETGLDYDRAFSPRDVQLANLRRHLELALEVGRPVILHCRSAAGRRDAQDDLLHALVEAGIGGFERVGCFAGRPGWVGPFAGRPPAVLHSFSGPVDYAERALDLGLAISFSGLAFRRGEEASAQVARLVPADRLLVETDAPYLSPPGAPRRRNEPRWVAVTARWVAEQRGEDPERLGEGLVSAYDGVFGSP